jgi:hypothetical protein
VIGGHRRSIACRLRTVVAIPRGALGGGRAGILKDAVKLMLVVAISYATKLLRSRRDGRYLNRPFYYLWMAIVCSVWCVSFAGLSLSIIMAFGTRFGCEYCGYVRELLLAFTSVSGIVGVLLLSPLPLLWPKKLERLGARQTGRQE